MTVPIPKATDGTVQKVLIGYYNAYTPGDEINDEEVAENSEVSEDVARRQKRFLTSIGLLNKDGNTYNLTEKGHNIGSLFEFDKHQKAYAELREVLLDWEPTSDFEATFEGGSMAEEKLFDEVAFVTDSPGAEDSTRKSAGINCLIDWYKQTGIIEETADGNWRFDTEDSTTEESNKKEEIQNNDLESEEGSSDQPPQSANSAEQTSDVETADLDELSSDQTQTNGMEVSLNISMEISDESDPDKVEEVLTAVREGIEADQDEEIDQTESDDDQDADLNQFS